MPLLLSAALLSGAAAPQAWTLGLTASATLNPPAAHGFAPAPTPNGEIAGPALPDTSHQAQITPSLFSYRSGYRGEGFIPGSSVGEQQSSKFKPTPGVNLRLPLQ